jgi:hypothetical protein
MAKTWLNYLVDGFEKDYKFGKKKLKKSLMLLLI